VPAIAAGSVMYLQSVTLSCPVVYDSKGAEVLWAQEEPERNGAAWPFSGANCVEPSRAQS
jgi:hypothetical protein